MFIKKTYTGYWNYPDNPGYIFSGTLNIDGINNFTLTAIEGPISITELVQIRNIRTNEPIPTITGIVKDSETNKDYQITLFNLRVISYFGSTLIKTIYSAQYVIFDAHFSSIKDIETKDIFLKPQLIKYWLPTKNYDFSLPTTNSKFEYAFSYKQPPPINLYRCKTFKIYIYFRASYKLKFDNLPESNESIFINIEFIESQDFTEIIKMREKIRNWFAIANSLSVSIEEFEMRQNREGTSKRNLPVMVADSNVYTSYKDNSNSHILLYKDIADISQNIFENWFTKYESLYPVLKTYFETIYNPNLYDYTAFLNLVFALEIYHKRKNPYAPQIVKRFRNKKDKLLSQIQDKNDREQLKSWLEKKDGINLKSRLLDLITSHEYITKEFINDFELFTNQIVKTRHFLVHNVKPENEELIIKKDEIKLFTAKLRILLQIVFLYEMEIPQEVIIKNIRKPWQNNHYFKRK